jgi:hypothetical protein
MDRRTKGQMAMSRLKRSTGNLLLMLGGLVVGTLLLEIGLRIGGVSYPSFFASDEHSGWAHRPGAEGWYRKEGEGYIRINSEGLRDREHDMVKSANTLRIAVLGDSYAAAFQVPVENAFWAVMERDLGTCEALADQRVEVVNFGVDGYGTAQELMTLRHRVWNYGPDLVLLAFVTGNDISDNSRALDQDPLRPYFVYRDGELILDASFLESAAYRARQTWYAQLAYRIVNSSRVFQLVNESKNSLKEYRIAMQRYNPTSDGVMEELGLQSAIYLEPGDPVWAEAWRVTEGLILLMRDEVMEKGADFVVVALSCPIQVHPDPSVREDYMAALGVHDLFYPDLRIKKLGAREGFSVLNLAQPFQAYAEENQVFLHGFENTTMGEGHWNSEGHQLAGQLIARRICQQLLDSR